MFLDLVSNHDAGLGAAVSQVDEGVLRQALVRRNIFARLYPLQARVGGVSKHCFYIHVLPM